MGTGVGSRVEWKEIRELAQLADDCYKLKLPGHRPKYEECQNKAVVSSYELGVPELMTDITTPFPIEFPVAKTLYQRFDFAYFNKIGDEDGYMAYASKNRRPVMIAEYLSDTDDVDYLNNNYSVAYVHVDDLIPGSPPDNTRSLIESVHPEINAFWKCEKQSDKLASELYFVTNQDSICPCPAIYRVCHAVSQDWNCKNGNGNGITFDGWRPYPDAIESVTTELRPYIWPKYSAVTLNQVDYLSLAPEYGDHVTNSIPLYPPPTTSCCARSVFPRIGYEGGEKHPTTWEVVPGPITMFDTNIFYKDYWGAVTKPFTESEIHPDLRKCVTLYDEYHSKEEYVRSTPVKFPEEIYAYELCGTWERWPVCKEGREVSVRLSLLRFYTLDEGVERPEYEDDEYRKAVKVKYAYAVTSIVVKLEGNLQPAIRNRWYDMIYEKMKFVAGRIPYGKALPGLESSEVPEGVYPQGTTWNAAGHQLMTHHDKPLSRWLWQNFGWAPNPDVRYMIESWFGEKYWSMFLCARNANPNNKWVTCTGMGLYNALPGCFCSEGIYPTPIVDSNCYDLACNPLVPTPWRMGGCLNETCLVAPGQEQLKTHWATVAYLNNIGNFIKTYKVPESSVYFETLVPWKLWCMPKTNSDYIAEDFTDVSLPLIYQKLIDRSESNVDYWSKCENLSVDNDILDKSTMYIESTSADGMEARVALRDGIPGTEEVWHQFEFECVMSFTGLQSEGGNTRNLTIKFDPNWMYASHGDLIYKKVNLEPHESEYWSRYFWACDDWYNPSNNPSEFVPVYNAAQLPRSIITVTAYYGPNGNVMKKAEKQIYYQRPYRGCHSPTYPSLNKDMGVNATEPMFEESIPMVFEPTDYQYHFNVVVHIKIDAIPYEDEAMLEAIVGAGSYYPPEAAATHEYIFGTSKRFGYFEYDDNFIAPSWRYPQLNNPEMGSTPYIDVILS